MPMRKRFSAVAALVAFALSAVLVLAAVASADSGHGHRHGPPPHKGPPPKTLPPVDVSQAENCDFIASPGNELCMLPFPDDYYTVPSASSETGRQINFKDAGMPENVAKQHIEAAPYNA